MPSTAAPYLRRDDFDWADSMRPRFFDGFHRCIPAMALAGNDLVVDHIIEYASGADRLRELLDGLDVFACVGVHCDPGELDRARERSGAIASPGEGRAHLEENRIHELGPYDLKVNTPTGVTPEVVAAVTSGWAARKPVGALFGA